MDVITTGSSMEWSPGNRRVFVPVHRGPLKESERAIDQEWFNLHEHATVFLQ